MTLIRAMAIVAVLLSACSSTSSGRTNSADQTDLFEGPSETSSLGASPEPAVVASDADSQPVTDDSTTLESPPAQQVEPTYPNETDIVDLADRTFKAAPAVGVIAPTPPSDLVTYLNFWSEFSPELNGQQLSPRQILCIETLGVARFRERPEDLAYPRAAVFPYLWERSSYIEIARLNETPIAEDTADTRTWPPTVERMALEELRVPSESGLAELTVPPDWEAWQVSWETAPRSFVAVAVLVDPKTGDMSTPPRIRDANDLSRCIANPDAATEYIPASVLVGI